MRGAADKDKGESAPRLCSSKACMLLRVEMVAGSVPLSVLLRGSVASERGKRGGGEGAGDWG